VKKIIGRNTKPVTVKDIAVQLEENNGKTQPTTFLEAAGVPPEAMTLAGKGRASGKILHPTLVPWLAQAGVVKPAAKKSDESAKDQKSK